MIYDIRFKIPVKFNSDCLKINNKHINKFETRTQLFNIKLV